MGKPSYIEKYRQSTSSYATSTDEESSIGGTSDGSALEDLEPGEQRWGPQAQTRWKVSVGLCLFAACGLGAVLAPPLDLGRLVTVNVHKGAFHSDTEVFLYPTDSGFVDAQSVPVNDVNADLSAVAAS